MNEKQPPQDEAPAQPAQDKPLQMYTRQEIMDMHPIAYRKARQRAMAEQRKLTLTNLHFGSIALMGR